MLSVKLLKTEAAELESELAQFEPKRKRLALIKELIRTYSDSPSDQKMEISASTALSHSHRFAFMGVTDAIKRFLEEKSGEFVSPRDIAKGIIAGGHSSASPNFFNIVYTICKRKAEKGEFEVQDRAGKKVFRIKK